MKSYRIAELVEFALYLILYSYQNIVKAFIQLVISSAEDHISGRLAVKWVLILTCAFHLLWMTPLASSVFLLWIVLTSCKFHFNTIII